MSNVRTAKGEKREETFPVFLRSRINCRCRLLRNEYQYHNGGSPNISVLNVRIVKDLKA